MSGTDIAQAAGAISENQKRLEKGRAGNSKRAPESPQRAITSPPTTGTAGRTGTTGTRATTTTTGTADMSHSFLVDIDEADVTVLDENLFKSEELIIQISKSLARVS